jgi:DNA-binding XRE family transcriptional regulator
VTLTDGDHAAIARHEDEALRARAGDEAAEDAMTARIVGATEAKIASKDGELPAAVWAAIERGENPVRAIRTFRGLTQGDVAERAAVRQSIVADIEAGKQTGSVASLKAIAKAPGMPLGVILG